MFGRLAVASILTAALACDKRESGAPAADGSSRALEGKPVVVALLFGERTDARLLPLATLTGGRIRPLVLDVPEWRFFDSLYFAPDARFTVYRDGAPLDSVRVIRPMWENGASLYRLPGCRILRPLAAAELRGAASVVMVERLATSAPVGGASARGTVAPSDADSAKSLLARTAGREGITERARGELQLVSRAIRTGATERPTLVSALVEKGVPVGKPRHVLVIGDWAEGTGFTAGYVHVPDDSTRETRRFIDHADLTGDGVDEIVLEGTRSGGESYLVFMGWAAGKWRELARTGTSWCGDPVK